MNTLIRMFTTNSTIVYLLGMTFVVVLAVIFSLSFRYYMKAKDLVPYLRKIRELVDKISELKNKVEDCEKQLKDKLAELTQAQRFIQQGKDAEKWMKQSKDEIDQLQKDLQHVRAEMQVEQSQKSDLDRQISERQQQLIELNQKATETEQQVRDAAKKIENIQQENAALTKQVPALRAERDEILKEIGLRRSRIADLEKEIQAKEDLLSKKKEEQDRLVGAIAAKKAELELLKEQIEKYTKDSNEQREDFNKQIEVKRKELADLEGRAVNAQRAISEWNARREESGEKWKNLDTPIVRANEMRNPTTGQIDESEWLDKLEQNLESNGFIFDERTIRAFHTGLKCVQQTPLVVLAGISGTGKSLLPELYASALGMNFLSVPVQPRWDSPQDLFGFYNYMEGRYKATELARLLWQFDRYNNNEARKDYNKNNLPLNLVLLDEMNLARVEYYFSDLLSKLETRNGLNPEDKSERQKAEIELECNAADKVDSMRHLFVSPYTLFVGTMNEDESTQTLSDKVIDRANILRFGMPKMLTEKEGSAYSEPDKSGFISSYSQLPRISAVEWDDWCKGLKDAENDSDALTFWRQTVTPVAESLKKINRAYGFRVEKAMKLYVMNYPGSYREAVADQIEMKILPKLNGVELQDEGFNEVKDALRTAIAATKDEKLSNAFEEACPESGTFFKWRGVMR